MTVETQNHAQQSIRRNFKPEGVVACEKGYYEQERWLRDAVWGLLWTAKAGGKEDLQTTRKVLDDFLNYSPNVPFRIIPFIHELYPLIKIPRRTMNDLKTPGNKKILNPEVRKIKDSYVADSFLILMLAGNYLSSSLLSPEERTEFWSRQEGNVKLFLEKYLERFVGEDELVSESPFSTRRDCLIISGKAHQTNVYWHKTIADLANGVENFDPEFALELRRKGKKIKEEINNRFWSEDHYIDWIDKDEQKHDHFDSLGDFWAIVSGIATQEQADKILDYVPTHKMIYGENDIAFVSAVHPAYHKKFFDRFLRLVKFTKYWNGADKEGLFWPETTLMYAAALKKADRNEEAGVALSWMETLFEKYSTFYEVHHADDSPGDTKVLFGIERKAPKSFTMALGLYLWVKANWEELGLPSPQNKTSWI